jgi:hypothetical protein
LLLEVPQRPENLEEMSDEDFLERLASIYSKKQMIGITQELIRAREAGPKWHGAFRERYFVRMYDLSTFVGELKQRYTQFYNKKHGRRGPLWQDRFKSVLVQEKPGALRTMAAYIDLNPVRARIVKDPKDYRWSGYGEAVAGRKEARKGLAALVDQLHGAPVSGGWPKVQGVYRWWLYQDGQQKTDERGRIRKPGFDRAESEAVFRKQGQLCQAVLATTRMRYFADGLAIGAQAFLEEVFASNRNHFSAKRQSGARPMKGVTWGGLMNLRDLRKEIH